MEETWAFILLPLLYLNMTWGLPPGTLPIRPASDSLIGVDGPPGSGNQSLESNMKTSEFQQYVKRIELNFSAPFQSSPTRTDEQPAALALSSKNTTTFTKVGLRDKCDASTHCDGEFTECRSGICKCQSGYLPRMDNAELCGDSSFYHVETPHTDPTMIGVVIGLALMSVTLCIVLRLFAKARFRENRTIFNTPNPRLMNVSLLKTGSKTLLRGNSATGGNRSRRGSTASNQSTAEPPSPGSLLDEGDVGRSGGNGGIPITTRPKPMKQMSIETASEGTPGKSHPGNSKAKYRQDSLASNV